MQQEWKTDPHPTLEKAMVPSTGNLLGWHRQTVVLRGTQKLVVSFARNSRAPMGHGTFHAGRALQPESFTRHLPGTVPAA